MYRCVLFHAVVSARLAETKVISPEAFMDVFALFREKYQAGIDEVFKATVNMIAKDPSQIKMAKV